MENLPQNLDRNEPEIRMNIPIQRTKFNRTHIQMKKNKFGARKPKPMSNHAVNG